jgi:glycosyltransferase involved in cell wall biosynthesis
MTDEHVVILGQLPPPVHGSTIMTARLRDALKQSGRHIEVVERRFSSTIDQVGRVSMRKVLLVPLLWWRLSRAVRSRPRATVMFLTDRPGSFLIDAVSTRIASRGGRSLVHYVHTQGFRRLALRGRVWNTLVGRVLGSADLVVCLSPALARDIEPFVDHTRIRIIPNTVGDACAGARSSSVKCTIVFVSNLFPSKRPHLVVDVVERLAAEGVDVRAMIAGAEIDENYGKVLRERIERSPMRDAVTLVGAVDETRRAELFDVASILLHPTEDDAQPLVILEAMRAGVPVVATAVGGIPDILDDPLLGEAVTGGDAGALAQAVRRVVDRDSAALSVKRRVRYQADYGLAAFSRNWDALLAEPRA